MAKKKATRGKAKKRGTSKRNSNKKRLNPLSQIQAMRESVSDNLSTFGRSVMSHARLPQKVREIPKKYLVAGFMAVCATPVIVFLFQYFDKDTTPTHTPSLRSALKQKSDLSDPLSFFNPSWDLQSWSLIGRDDPALPSGPVSFKNIVSDPDNHLGAEFQVSSQLHDRVLFWVDVYSRYDSRMKIIHDRFNLGVVYGYIDYRPLWKTVSNPVRRAIKIRNLERKIVKQLKQKMLVAAGVKSGAALSEDERAGILALLQRAGANTRAEMEKTISNLRTQTGQRDHFLKAIHRSRNLLPHIISHFRERQLPTVLARIPFVESSFNVRAESKIGAVGIWQFTVDTAQEMISLIDDSEWKDPLKQTSAAARLLRNYRTALPDWASTITAYNSGIGNVRKALKKHQANSVYDLLEHPEENGLGFAGENFYSEVIAATLVDAYKEEIFSQWMSHKQLTKLFNEGGNPFFDEVCHSDKDA